MIIKQSYCLPLLYLRLEGCSTDLCSNPYWWQMIDEAGHLNKGDPLACHPSNKTGEKEERESKGIWKKKQMIVGIVFKLCLHVFRFFFFFSLNLWFIRAGSLWVTYSYSTLFIARCCIIFSLLPGLSVSQLGTMSDNAYWSSLCWGKKKVSRSFQVER